MTHVPRWYFPSMRPHHTRTATARVVEIFDSEESRTDPDESPFDDPTDLVAAAKRNNGYAWLGIVNPEPEDVSALGEALGLHPFAVRDAASGRQQPKVQAYNEQLFVTIWALEAKPDAPDYDIVETFIFATEALLITVQHGAADPNGLREAIEDPLPGTKGVLGALYRVLAHFTAQYTEIANQLEDELQELENQVFDPSSNGDSHRIYQMRRRIGKVSRAVSSVTRSLERVVDELKDLEIGGQEARPYLQDVLADLVGCHQLIEDQEGSLAGIISSHENSVSIQQGKDARRVSAVAALIAVPAVVAGVYGMNFKNLPGVDWVYGWIAVVLGILAAIVLGATLFRRARWL